ncbi:hypothetical protein Angca_003302, partial [Angiostrongylus cantonensis]
VMLIVLVFSIVASAAPQCSFRDGDINARWQVSDDELTIEIVNKNIGDNQWTGIGFGPSMVVSLFKNDLEVVLVKIENNKPTLLTGFTSSYGPPTLDSTANVVPSLLSFNSNQLRLRFTRTLSSHGERSHSLEGCHQWNVVKQGYLNNGEVSSHSDTLVSIEVCPEECKKNVVHE